MSSQAIVGLVLVSIVILFFVRKWFVGSRHEDGDRTHSSGWLWGDGDGGDGGGGGGE